MASYAANIYDAGKDVCKHCNDCDYDLSRMRGYELPSSFWFLLKRRQQAGLRVAATALRPWLFCPADDAFAILSILNHQSAGCYWIMSAGCW